MRLAQTRHVYQTTPHPHRVIVLSRSMARQHTTFATPLLAMAIALFNPHPSPTREERPDALARAGHNTSRRRKQFAEVPSSR